MYQRTIYENINIKIRTTFIKYLYCNKGFQPQLCSNLDSTLIVIPVMYKSLQMTRLSEFFKNLLCCQKQKNTFVYKL